MGEQTVGILPVLESRRWRCRSVLALHPGAGSWAPSTASTARLPAALVVSAGWPSSSTSAPRRWPTWAAGGGAPPGALPRLTLVAGYLQVAWLLLGAGGSRRARSRARGRWARAGSSRLRRPRLGAARSRRGHRALRDGLRCLVAGLAYLAAAPFLARRRAASRAWAATFARLALVLLRRRSARRTSALSFGPRPEASSPASPLLMTSTSSHRGPRASRSWPGSSRASARSRCTPPISRGGASGRRPASTASPRPPGRCGTFPRSSAPSTRAWATCFPPGTSTSRSTTRRRAS